MAEPIGKPDRSDATSPECRNGGQQARRREGKLSHLLTRMGVVRSPSVEFAEAARTLRDEARRLGLAAPNYRSPPRLEGAERTVRRSAGGDAQVAVRIRRRPWNAVLADMVEGVVVANRLWGPAADRCRTELWRGLDVQVNDNLENDGEEIEAGLHAA